MAWSILIGMAICLFAAQSAQGAYPISLDGFWRHVQGIEFNNVTVNYLNAEMRPPFFLEDVTFASFNNVTGYRALMVPMFVLRNVSDFNTRGCISVPDMHLDRIVKQDF